MYQAQRNESGLEISKHLRDFSTVPVLLLNELFRFEEKIKKDGGDDKMKNESS